MPNPSTAQGIKPVRHNASDAGFNGSQTAYQIASGYATTISTYDVVKYLTTGFINRAAAGDQMRGVAVGFRWREPGGAIRISNQWPGGTVTFQGEPATVYVVDDPNTEFQARFAGATVVTQADTGQLYNISTTAGSSLTGMGAEGIDSTTGSTSAGQFRFLGFANIPNNDTASAYAVGRFAPALHDFRVNTGI